MANKMPRIQRGLDGAERNVHSGQAGNNPIAGANQAALQYDTHYPSFVNDRTVDWPFRKIVL